MACWRLVYPPFPGAGLNKEIRWIIKTGWMSKHSWFELNWLIVNLEFGLELIFDQSRSGMGCMLKVGQSRLGMETNGSVMNCDGNWLLINHDLKMKTYVSVINWGWEQLVSHDFKLKLIVDQSWSVMELSCWTHLIVVASWLLFNHDF